MIHKLLIIMTELFFDKVSKVCNSLIYTFT